MCLWLVPCDILSMRVRRNYLIRFRLPYKLWKQLLKLGKVRAEVVGLSHAFSIFLTPEGRPFSWAIFLALQMVFRPLTCLPEWPPFQTSIDFIPVS